MTRSHLAFSLAAGLLAGSAFYISGQKPAAPVRRVEYPLWETKVLAPREATPAHYVQVSPRELEAVGAEGWELVSVAPFVLSNEARGQERNTVTQAYPAYYFKRLRPDR